MKIFMAIPCRNNTSIKTMNSVVMSVKHLQDEGHDVVYSVIRMRPVDTARNVLASTFLKTDCDYLFFVDDDHVFEPGQALQLLESCGTEMISPVICRKSLPFIPMIFDYELRMVLDYPHNELFQAVGGLCFIHRSVFTRFREKFPNTKFFHTSDELGEDLWFWQHALKAGVKPLVHSGILFGHWSVEVRPFMYEFFKDELVESVSSQGNLERVGDFLVAKRNCKIFSSLKEVKE